MEGKHYTPYSACGCRRPGKGQSVRKFYILVDLDMLSFVSKMRAENSFQNVYPFLPFNDVWIKPLIQQIAFLPVKLFL